LNAIVFIAMGVAFVCMAGAFGLAFYVDAHVRHLKKSGAAPKGTKALLYRVMTIDVSVLYGRDYVALDETTRQLVPIVRVLLPMGFGAIAGVLIWAGLTQS
jgi:hypothetical protein